MAAPVNTPSPKELQATLDGPAGVPPSGVLPNLERPAHFNALLVMVFILAISFSTLCVAARIYTKVFIIRSFRYEDCMCTI